jgi:hypothetical protein
MIRWFQLVLVMVAGVAARGEEKPASPWSVETLRSRLCMRPDGSYCALSEENGGCVVTFGPRGKEAGLRLPADGIPPARLYYMTTDSEGGLWLFADSSHANTLYHDGKEWRIYQPDRERGLPFHSKEIAFQAQLAKGEHYRIGRPADCFYYPIFTADGRILYQNEWRRACYFDGKQWHAPYGNAEVDGATLDDQPFFHNGKVTVRVKGKCYQMPDDAWSALVDDREPRPWKEVPNVPQPFSQPKGPDIGIAVPADCPIPSAERTWKIQAAGGCWVGSATRVAVSFGAEWIEIPVTGTPLAEARGVSEVVADPHGRWFFGCGYGRPDQYAIYQSAPLTVQPVATALGTVDRPFAVLEPAWRANRKPEELQMRYRIDDAPWSAHRPCGPIETGALPTKGRHRLEIELSVPRQLVRSVPVSYSFEVGYDLAPMIRDLVTQLGAGGFAERERATRELVRLGPVAVPDLTRAADDRDPEIRLRAREILKQIQPASTESKRRE